ncbi:hypothetical protein BFW01_g1696 [Lasiodiplodia theobromae]|nr:hypothetical protein BFW01_g1696 [Lasiodiplodia theobromae]
MMLHQTRDASHLEAVERAWASLLRLHPAFRLRGSVDDGRIRPEIPETGTEQETLVVRREISSSREPQDEAKEINAAPYCIRAVHHLATNIKTSA